MCYSPFVAATYTPCDYVGNLECRSVFGLARGDADDVIPQNLLASCLFAHPAVINVAIEGFATIKD
jgi:hypothetical protein